MDLQTGLISLGIVFVLSVVVYLISVFGIREKTYEEAIAEQRQRNEVWDVPTTATSKSSSSSKADAGKRNRKVVGRRWKEKGSASEGGSSSSSSSSTSSDQHLHVGFKPNAEIITVASTAAIHASVTNLSQKTNATKRTDEPKSILVTKRERSSPSVGRDTSARNTTSTATKGGRESKEKTPPSTSSSSVSVSITRKGSEEPVVVEKKKSKERGTHHEERVMVETTIAKQPKEAKKNNNDVGKHLSVSTAVKPAKRPKYDDEALTAQHIQKLLNAAVLSHSEIQSLIDLLLNRQQSNSGDDFEWLQPGQKVDPISSLKKQLIEREESLAEERARTQATTTKLTDVRKELNAEKARTAQFERTLKERQAELQAQIQRNISDASAQQAKFQVAQAKYEEEHNVAVKKLKQENQQLRQAIVQFEAKSDNFEREKSELQESVEKVQAKLHSANASGDQLQAEIHRLQECIRNVEIAKFEDENNYKQHTGELTNQLCESQSLVAHLRDAVSKLQSVEAENALLDRLAEAQKLSSSYEAARDQLEAEVKELKRQEAALREQLALLQAQLQEEKMKFLKSDKEITDLRDENEMLASQLSQLSERQEAEGHEGSEDNDNDVVQDKTNGHIIPEENGKETKILLSEHEAIIHEKEKQIAQLTTELNEKSRKIQDLLSEVENWKEEASRFGQEVDVQKKKNNELREKNWKAVEALNLTEKSANDKIRSVERSSNERIVEAQKAEQKLAQDVLERIFPTVRIEKNVEFSAWVCDFEGRALEMLEERSTEAKNGTSTLDDIRDRLNVSEDNCARFQAEVQHYKTVLAETEGMLNKLQSSVEDEELKWREKLSSKEEEFNKLREEKKELVDKLEELTVAQQTVAEMGSNLELLREELKGSDEAKSTLERVSSQLADANDRIQLLERDRAERLKDVEFVERQLSEEKRTNKELTAENIRLTGQLDSGIDSQTTEQELSQLSTNGPQWVSSQTSDYESRFSGASSDVWPRSPSLASPGNTANNTSSISSSLLPHCPLVASDSVSSTKSLQKSKPKKKRERAVSDKK